MILNFVLGDRVLEKTFGVVLIDKVDLYLHPQWQPTILGDLHAIFPNVQFIVSAHTVVINLLSRKQIRICAGGMNDYAIV